MSIAHSVRDTAPTSDSAPTSNTGAGENEALWVNRRGRFHVGPAPVPTPGPHQLVVRQRATSMNPIDTMVGPAMLVVVPWLHYPAVFGGDVSGEVVAVGERVTRFQPGDRVVSNALGLERDRNDPAQGAFQHLVLVEDYMTSPIPDAVSFEQASVLPLTLSTAATGLFQHDHLALHLPTRDRVERHETVVVWGGATSVGSNAIQLARAAGYRVVATSSTKNFDHLRRLGAEGVVDRTSPHAVDLLQAQVGDQPLAGVWAIGDGSVAPSVDLAARCAGPRRVVSSMPARVAWALALRAGAWSKHVQVTGVWGGSLHRNPVGSAIWQDYLPGALADGSYLCAPDPVVAGHGLAAIPGALERLRAGVSASKVVVTL